MTMTQRRMELAAALECVPDVTGYPFRPEVLAEGAAWPILGRPAATHKAGSAYEITWLVRVVTPQDEVAATKWFDVRWPYLYEALTPVGFVLGFDAVLLDASGGTLFAFEITLRSEE
jgi:hypothetical protein